MANNGFTILLGSYAWMDEIENPPHQQMPVQQKKKGGKGGEKNILYPVFKDAENIVSEQFWKTLLNMAAYGKFQKNIHMKGNVLIFKNKSKNFSQEIDFTNVEIAANQFISFMNTKAGIFSPDEIEKHNQDFRESRMVMPTELNSWSQVRRKVQRDKMIFEFIERFSDEISPLNSQQEKQMEDTIRMGILAEYFNSSTIIVTKSNIERIEGLIFENGHFSIDQTVTRTKRAKQSHDTFIRALEDETEDIPSMTLPATAVIKEGSNNNASIFLTKNWIKFVAAQEKKIVDYEKTNIE